MAELKFKRVIIKLSGEALAGETGMGIDHAKLGAVVDQIVEVKKLGAEVGIVIGGGNFWRGRQADSEMNRSTADHMGMLATVINALAIQDALERKGMEVLISPPIRAPRSVRLKSAQTHCFSQRMSTAFTTATPRPIPMRSNSIR